MRSLLLSVGNMIQPLNCNLNCYGKFSAINCKLYLFTKLWGTEIHLHRKQVFIQNPLLLAEMLARSAAGRIPLWCPQPAGAHRTAGEEVTVVSPLTGRRGSNSIIRPHARPTSQSGGSK